MEHIVGKLTADATITDLTTTKVIHFKLSETEAYYDANNIYIENTRHIKVALWGNAGLYTRLKKGAWVVVVGKTSAEAYLDEAGNCHAYLVIDHAQTVRILHSAQDPTSDLFENL